MTASAFNNYSAGTKYKQALRQHYRQFPCRHSRQISNIYLFSLLFALLYFYQLGRARLLVRMPTTGEGRGGMC